MSRQPRHLLVIGQAEEWACHRRVWEPCRAEKKHVNFSILCNLNRLVIYKIIKFWFCFISSFLSLSLSSHISQWAGRRNHAASSTLGLETSSVKHPHLSLTSAAFHPTREHNSADSLPLRNKGRLFSSFQ